MEAQLTALASNVWMTFSGSDVKWKSLMQMKQIPTQWGTALHKSRCYAGDSSWQTTLFLSSHGNKDPIWFAVVGILIVRLLRLQRERVWSLSARWQPQLTRRQPWMRIRVSTWLLFVRSAVGGEHYVHGAACGKHPFQGPVEDIGSTNFQNKFPLWVF